MQMVHTLSSRLVVRANHPQPIAGLRDDVCRSSSSRYPQNHSFIIAVVLALQVLWKQGLCILWCWDFRLLNKSHTGSSNVFAEQMMLTSLIPGQAARAALARHQSGQSQPNKTMVSYLDARFILIIVVAIYPTQFCRWSNIQAAL